ncbi:hypothetical protein [Levilactobacillus wangkuiensis]|uniref:hypothetical protein n=1 Tax=Levilactobacillus wangkuiensis TaxID=2799566 RepID=UPI00194F18FC|nr:hypothetical protein [Levilactobacillus wangkuiensis]
MKKLIMQLVLVLTMAFGLGMGTSALADNVVSRGETQVGITFTGNPTTRISDDKIPNGKTPTKTSGAATTATHGHDLRRDGAGGSTADNANPGKKAGVTALKAAAADVLAGRLPQTSEVQSLLADLVGILLLIVLILVAIIYHQARQLQEKE